MFKRRGYKKMKPIKSKITTKWKKILILKQIWKTKNNTKGRKENTQEPRQICKEENGMRKRFS
jgi:hypothetical protein